MRIIFNNHVLTFTLQLQPMAPNITITMVINLYCFLQLKYSDFRHNIVVQ